MSVTTVLIAPNGDSAIFTTSDSQNITVSISAGKLTLQEANDAAADDLNFIYSPMDIVIVDIPVGSTVDITIDLPSATPDNASAYKLIDGVWVNFDANCQFNTQRTSVTFQITDGGYGDNDNAADGQIIDPIGLATEVNNPSNNDAKGTAPAIKKKCLIFIAMFEYGLMHMQLRQESQHHGKTYLY